MTSNILFGGDFLNGVFGFVAGTLTCVIICLLKKVTTNKFVLVTPIGLVPSLVISIWLSYTLQVPYNLIFGSLFIGQAISAYTVGIFVLYVIERVTH